MFAVNSVDAAGRVLICAGVMSIRSGACGWASIVSVITWCELGVAAPAGPKVHLGLEASIAADQPESNLEVTKGMASLSAGRIPILKGKISLDAAKVFAVAPIATAAAASDHWLSVCGKRWLMSETDRANLKAFLEQQLVKAPSAAPVSAAAPLPAPAAMPAPAAIPASTSETTQTPETTRQPAAKPRR